MAAFAAQADDEHDIAVMLRQKGTEKKLGVFSLKSQNAAVEVPAPDGSYENLADGTAVEIIDGKLQCAGRPVIFCWDAAEENRPAAGQ